MSNKEDLIQRYLELYDKIYGKEIREVVIDKKFNDLRYIDEPLKSLNKKEKELGESDAPWKRIKSLNKPNNFEISGCIKCMIDENLAIRNQDAPGFVTSISKIKYIIVGLETNNPDDFHISYDYFPPNGSNIDFFKNYKLFFKDIAETSYITDIAKCRSTKLGVSRKKCVKEYLIKELELIIRLTKNPTVILQGNGVYSYLKNFLKPEGEFYSLKSKSSTRKTLFSCLKSKIDNKFIREIPVLIFPHTSRYNQKLWVEIETDEIFKKIDLKIKEIRI